MVRQKKKVEPQKIHGNIKGHYAMRCKEIVIFPYTCWKCNSTYHAYYVRDEFGNAWGDISSFETEFVTENGETIDGMEIYERCGDDCEDTLSLRFNPKVIDAIKNFIITNEGKGITIGPIKERYSKTVESSYMSFGCPYCDAIFGDWFYDEAIMGVENGEIIPTKILKVDIVVESEPRSLTLS